MNIRQVVASDARPVAIVHVQTWQAAYRGIVPDAYLDALSVEHREQVWRESIRRGTPEIWVAEVAEQLIGWTAFGPSRDQDARPETGELEAIYVLPGHWTSGVGRALWQLTRRRLIERGFSTATLWVLADNARAIRFYTAAGLAPNMASEKQITVGGRSLAEVRYETTFMAAAGTAPA